MVVFVRMHACVCQQDYYTDAIADFIETWCQWVDPTSGSSRDMSSNLHVHYRL